MKTNKILLAIALICILIAAGIYAGAYLKKRHTSQTNTPAPVGKIVTTNTPDGMYVAHIRSIMTTPEDTSITFAPVTYFEGTEASTTAQREVPCVEKPLEACVPTLAYGFYVQEEGSPLLTAPIVFEAPITLRDSQKASMNQLRRIERPFEPVFDITVINGSITSITEKSPG